MLTLPRHVEEKVSGELAVFGRDEHELRGHRVGVGGTILPDGSLRGVSFRSEGVQQHERQGEGSQEGGSTARPRAGRRASAAGQGSAAYAVGTGLATILRVDEVLAHYPGCRWAGASTTLSYLAIPVRPFTDLSYRAILIMELPRHIPDWLRADPGRLAVAPQARVWAVWADGIRVHCFHAYPDRSACTHTPGEWQLLRDPLMDLVSYSVCWLAGSLFLQRTRFWPGPQHTPTYMRVRRDVRREYCGCSRHASYEACCRDEDLAKPPGRLTREAYLAERTYRREIARRGWPKAPPFKVA